MNSRLVVDRQDGLKELRPGGPLPQPAFVRVAARFFSYLFHPVFIPVLVIAFMLYQHPYLFAGFSGFDKIRVLMQAFVNYTFFPVVTVLLLKALNFISSFQLDKQKDRIIPLIACGIWYFWIWYVWRNLPDYPKASVQLTLAVWISASLALLANIIMKISLHAISVGVMFCFMILLALSTDVPMGIHLSLAFLITGITCTSRFIVSDHNGAEVYGGLALGTLSMLLAWTLG